MEKNNRMMKNLMIALQKMIAKNAAKKNNSNIDAVIQKTQERLNDTSRVMETRKEDVSQIDFGTRPNFLIHHRQSFFRTRGISYEPEVTVPYGLKVKETKEERSLNSYDRYKTGWQKHQSKHERFFKSEALKTKYPNPSTFMSSEPGESLIQHETQSIIFSGDDYGEKMNIREQHAVNKKVNSTTAGDRVPVQCWYDQLRASDKGSCGSRFGRESRGERVFYP